MRMTASWLRSSRINRIQGCAAPRARCELPSELSSLVRTAGLHDHHSLPLCSRPSRARSLCDGAQLPLTVAARSGQSNQTLDRDEEMIAGGSNKEMRRNQIGLDTKGPIQGLGFDTHNPPRQEAAVTSPPHRCAPNRSSPLPRSGFVQSQKCPTPQKSAKVVLASQWSLRVRASVRAQSASLQKRAPVRRFSKPLNQSRFALGAAVY